MTFQDNRGDYCPEWWQGRYDGDEQAHLRWHQVVQKADLLSGKMEGAACFLGFAVDEGVRRNLGRVGAQAGPRALRGSMASLPWQGTPALWDAGDVYCSGQDLEGAQESLATGVVQILEAKALPVVLGGGHETAWGHYQGIMRYLRRHKPQSRLGIINIDAHFDLRQPSDGCSPSSGTSFWHMWQDSIEHDTSFHYLVLGLLQSGNTRALFDTAEASGTRYLFAHELDKPDVVKAVQDMAREVDYLYLTVCMDVFASGYAPGVSAPNPMGILPAHALDIIDAVVSTGKLLSFDIAELSPKYDIDQHTSKLAAQLVFGLLSRQFTI